MIQTDPLISLVQSQPIRSPVIRVLLATDFQSPWRYGMVGQLCRTRSAGSPDAISMQFMLPFWEHEPRKAVHGLWIFVPEAAKGFAVRHKQMILDPQTGASMLEAGDKYLLRREAGLYELFASEASFSTPEAVASCLGSVRDFLEMNGRSKAVPGDVREAIAISFKPGRFKGCSERAQRKRRTARTNVEEVLFRLSMVPWCSSETTTIANLASMLGPDAHPILSTLLHREMADALLWACLATKDSDYAELALPSYRLAAEEFSAYGLRHQWRTTTGNEMECKRLLTQPWLPSLETALGVGRTTLEFSVSRLCGFRLELGPNLPALSVSRPANVARFISLGSMEFPDDRVATFADERPSPTRRLAARVSRTPDGIVLTAGLIDELRALLGMSIDGEPQTDVQALLVSSDTIDFGAGWAFHPDRPVSFSGRCDPARRHRIDLRANLPRGRAVDLSIAIASRDAPVRYFV